MSGGVRDAAWTRLAVAPVVLVAITIIAMLLPELTGVDSARSVLAVRYAESDPDPAVLAAIRTELGLDQPLLQRVADRLGRLLTGDLGTSWVSETPVSTMLATAVPVSLSIMLGALALSFLVGWTAGMAAGYRPGSITDRAVRTGNRVAAAVPEFALAPLLVAVFAVMWQVLPSSGWRAPQYAILPVLALVPSLAAPVAATTREHVRDFREATFLTAARARGVGEWRLRSMHLARPALPGALSVLTFNAAGMIAGAAAIEVVFDIPGIGRMLVDAVSAQDIPVVQAGLLVATVVALAVGAVGDVVRLGVDPRAREANG